MAHQPHPRPLRRTTATLLVVALVGQAMVLYTEYHYFVAAGPLQTGWAVAGAVLFAGGLLGALACWLAARRSARRHPSPVD